MITQIILLGVILLALVVFLFIGSVMWLGGMKSVCPIHDDDRAMMVRWHCPNTYKVWFVGSEAGLIRKKWCGFSYKWHCYYRNFEGTYTILKRDVSGFYNAIDLIEGEFYA